jgi:hypothetical protein
LLAEAERVKTPPQRDEHRRQFDIDIRSVKAFKHLQPQVYAPGIVPLSDPLKNGRMMMKLLDGK